MAIQVFSISSGLIIVGGFEGYIRPDHGRHLWNEKAGTVRPGYGLYDRALGIMYMLGAWDLMEKEKQNESSQ